jgi:hypothetical protein
MAEFSGFFDAHIVDGKYDRVYFAEHFAKYFAAFIGNGVYGGKSNELMVRQEEVANMSVKVLSGQAYMNGYHYENDSDEHTLSIDVADGSLNRIDLVVLRWYNDERVIRLAVKKGGAASKPVAPDLQRDADFYELLLAEVYIKAGATSITQADITDRRLDKSVCGFVQGVVQQFDTTEFGIQLNSFIKKFEVDSVAKMEQVLAKLNNMADSNDLASLIFDVENLKDFDVKSEKNIVLLNQTLGYTKKNLLPYPYNANPGMISLRNGIEWFDNGDGTLTALGTATINSYYTLYEGEFPEWLKPGKYFITAGPNHTEDCYILFNKNKKGTTEYVGRVTSLNNAEIVITEQDIREYDVTIAAIVAGGATVSRVTLKPMLRKAEILDDTWEPFRYSVDELYHEDGVEKGCFYRINNVTKVKEWINPPSKPGVEYCLTERWDKKPVYQKTFFVSTLPNKSVSSIGTNTQWDKVVSVSAYALDSNDSTYYPFPVILRDEITPIAVINKVGYDGNLFITTNADTSHLKAYVTVKYTK